MASKLLVHVLGDEQRYVGHLETCIARAYYSAGAETRDTDDE